MSAGMNGFFGGIFLQLTGSQEGAYTPLDLSGVTVVHCEGDGGLLRYGRFFSAIGLRTYAFYDRQKNDAIAHQIVDVFDATWELEQTGIEHLLAGETAMDVIHDYLATASEWDDYPRNPRKPERFEYDPNGDDDDGCALETDHNLVDSYVAAQRHDILGGGDFAAIGVR